MLGPMMMKIRVLFRWRRLPVVGGGERKRRRGRRRAGWRLNFALLGLVWAPAMAPAASPSLRSPLDQPLALTSSFGEYRANRLHAGVDLSTGGRIGVPVRAVAGGVVERVKVTAGGYGRALYLRLDDGRIAVFGHLDRFAPPVAEAVRERQLSARHYRVDWQWDREPLRFAAGDLVGWSGQAGTTVPHLHFEIRDGANQPLDPVAAGLPVRDRVPPTPVALRVIPRGRGALVAGSPFPYELPLPDGALVDGERVQRVTEPLELVGRASLEITVFDRDDAGRGRLAIAGARVMEGAEVGLEMRLDRFSWSNMARARHLYAGTSEGPGSRTRLRLDVPADGRDEILFAPSAAHPFGWIEAPDVETPLTLEFWDRSGNRARVLLRLVPGSVPDAEPTAAPSTASSGAENGRGTARLGVRAEARGALLAVEMRADPERVPQPVLRWESASPAGGKSLEVLPPPLRLAPGHWVSWLPIRRPGSLRVSGGSNEWRRRMPYYRVEAGESLTCTEESSGASLRIAAGGLYRDALVALEPAALRGDWGTLQPRSGAVRVGPGELCFRDRPMLLMPLQEGGAGESANVQLYRAVRRRGKIGWSRVGGSVATAAGGAAVSGWITRPGTYAAFADTSAPQIGEPVLEPSSYCAGILRIPLTDSGAGIDAESVSLEIDGQWVIAGFDAPRARIEARLVEALSPATHVLRIVARDRAGNVIEVKRTLKVSAL